MRKTCSLLFILWAISPALAYATPSVKIAHDADATAAKEKQQLISYENQRSKLVGRIETLGTLRQAEAFPIDKDGNRYAPEPAFDVRLRVGFDYRHTIAKLIWLDANYEHDMYSGIIAIFKIPKY